MQVLRWCGIGIIICGFIGLINAAGLYNADPTISSRMVAGIIAGFIMFLLSFCKNKIEPSQIRIQIDNLKTEILQKPEYKRLSDEEQKDFLEYLKAEANDIINVYNDKRNRYKHMREGTAKYAERKNIEKLSVVVKILKFKLIAISEIEKEIDYKNSDVARIKSNIKTSFKSLADSINDEDEL